MLIRQFFAADGRPCARQDGVVLLIALIMLVAMTLGGIALIRSVYSTNIIAGNMAFQQAATHAGDTGIEGAIKWLQDNNTCTPPTCNLDGDIFSGGYTSYRKDPDPGKSWSDLWTELVANQQVYAVPGNDTDIYGVSYVIQRLCNATGPAKDAACSISPSAVGDGNAKDVVDSPNAASKVYFRITSRVAGPRNTVSYIQAVVSM